MPLAQLTATIRAPFNQGVPGLYAQIVTWLAAHPNIIIQDVDWFRPESTYAGDENRMRISYMQATAPAVGGTWIVRLYQDDNTTGVTAQQAFTNSFGGGIEAVPFFVVDVTEHERARTGPNSLVVVCMSTGGANLGLVGHDRAVFVAEALGNIAAAAQGTADLYDASGRVVASGVTILNAGAVQWDVGQRNYVVVDEESGIYMGLPSCCGAVAPPAPVVTTSTPYPCPAYLSDQTNPVTS